MTTILSSRRFNQDTSGAKKAADQGPVFITDRGRPAYVLLSIEAYQRLTGQGHGNLIDELGKPEGIADIEITWPQFQEKTRPANFS